MIHIMQVKDGMVVLKNGVLLPVSRSHLQTVKEQINAYWGGAYMTFILLSDILTGSLRVVLCLFLLASLLPAEKPDKKSIAAGLAGAFVIAVLRSLTGFPDFYRMGLEAVWISVCAGRRQRADFRMRLFVELSD